MICTKCKAEIPKGAKTCPNCGKPVMMMLKPLAPLNNTEQIKKEEIKETVIQPVDEVVNNTIDAPKKENIPEVFDEIIETVATENMDEDIIENADVNDTNVDNVDETVENIIEDDIEETTTINNIEEINVDEYNEAAKIEALEEVATEPEQDLDYQEFIKTTTPPPTIDEVKKPYQDIPDYNEVDTNNDEYYDPIPEINEEMEKLGKRNILTAVLFIVFVAILLILYVKFIF